jgi:hypothetical protein
MVLFLQSFTRLAGDEIYPRELDQGNLENRVSCSRISKPASSIAARMRPTAPVDVGANPYERPSPRRMKPVLHHGGARRARITMTEPRSCRIRRRAIGQASSAIIPGRRVSRPRPPPSPGLCVLTKNVTEGRSRDMASPSVPIRSAYFAAKRKLKPGLYPPIGFCGRGPTQELTPSAVRSAWTLTSSRSDSSMSEKASAVPLAPFPEEKAPLRASLESLRISACNLRCAAESERYVLTRGSLRSAWIRARSLARSALSSPGRSPRVSDLVHAALATAARCAPGRR